MRITIRSWAIRDINYHKTIIPVHMSIVKGDNTVSCRYIQTISLITVCSLNALLFKLICRLCFRPIA